MFRVSQEIRLNASGARHYNDRNADENVSIFGKYHRTPNTDRYVINVPNVFVAPELTDPNKVQLLHFPNGAVRMNSVVNFIIKRNGTRGNIEVKLESPSGRFEFVPLKILDPERFEVSFALLESGLYKVHIKCNSVVLPKSPFIIVAISGNDTESSAPKVEIPIFTSDASKVTHRGLGLTHVTLHCKNEFIVDGSEAGNNILFVGISGPKGQCDEIVVKHIGRNVYKVTYRIQDPGDYVLAAKWGDQHIPGSPFSLSVF